ncbi:MAG: 50S ribosomal protein L28 [Rickettsiales bacterium]|nr:50S ribosomal protein L28 [Rickettsiales bacterium]
MPARCKITNKKLSVGHKVSHSNIKTKRTFNVNLQTLSFFSDTLNSSIRLSVAASTIRTIEKNGGIDAYLLNAASKNLSDEAKILRKRIKKTQEKAAKAS